MPLQDSKKALPFLEDYGKMLFTRGRGVVANMRPCQGRDRGFEPRRSRQSKETFTRGSFFIHRFYLAAIQVLMANNKGLLSFYIL